MWRFADGFRDHGASSANIVSTLVRLLGILFVKFTHAVTAVGAEVRTPISKEAKGKVKDMFSLFAAREIGAG